MKTQLNSVLRASVVVFVFLVAAKLLSFFKKILIGNLFGVSWVADTFFAASFLPYYLAIFFEGILFLGFLPLFSQIMAEKGKEEAQQFLCEIFLLMLFLTSLIVLLGAALAPWVIRELVPGFTPSEQDLTRSLFQILSLVLVFITLTAFFKALNSYFEHYAWAASSALIDGVAMIGVTLMAWKRWGIYGAAWAAVIGALSALILQAAFLFRKHSILPRRFTLRNPDVLKLFYFLIPMGIIWTFQQIPFVILNRFGSGMWEGTISALTIAQTLTTVPMGLVNHTVLFAIFPSLARQASENGPETLKETFFQTLKGGFFILIPVGLLLTVFARPLTAVFFAGGGIVEEGTRRIANSLVCFGWATFALYADLFMTQSLIAVRKPLPAIFLCATRAFLTYGIGYFLSTFWDYRGLALSFSLALAINFFLLFPLFFRLTPFRNHWRSLFGYSLKLILASGPLLLVGWFVNLWSIGAWISCPKTFVIAGLSLGAILGTGLYALLLSWLKVAELHSVVRQLKEGWMRKGWWLAEQSE